MSHKRVYARLRRAMAKSGIMSQQGVTGRAAFRMFQGSSRVRPPSGLAKHAIALCATYYARRGRPGCRFAIRATLAGQNRLPTYSSVSYGVLSFGRPATTCRRRSSPARRGDRMKRYDFITRLAGAALLAFATFMCANITAAAAAPLRIVAIGASNTHG